MCRKGKIYGMMTVQYQSHRAFVVLIVLIHTSESSTTLIIMTETVEVILMVGSCMHIYACSVHSLIIMMRFFGGTASDPIICYLFLVVQKTLKITARKFDVLTMGS